MVFYPCVFILFVMNSDAVLKDSFFLETYNDIKEIFEGKKSAEEIKKYLYESAQKGETMAQIAGAAKAMAEQALAVECRHETFDVCGTGGSGKSKPFNISTTTAIILASQGVRIAKHGNRKASSVSGSADVLEALGMELPTSVQEMENDIQHKGMAFLFAQVLHPKMKDLMPIRKSLGIRTIFNLLGPLTNPSHPSRQVVGVSSQNLLLPMAQVLRAFKKKSAIVLWGENGLDDATITGKTYFARFEHPEGEIETGSFCPEDFGLLSRSEHEIAGGKNPEENAQIILDILEGKDTGAKRDIVLLNSGIAFRECKKTAGIEEGIALAEKAIFSGDALAMLYRLQGKGE